MGVLAVLAVVAGVVQIPFGVTDWLDELPRADVRRLDRRSIRPNDGLEAFGLVLGR